MINDISFSKLFLYTCSIPACKLCNTPNISFSSKNGLLLVHQKDYYYNSLLHQAFTYLYTSLRVLHDTPSLRIKRLFQWLIDVAPHPLMSLNLNSYISCMNTLFVRNYWRDILQPLKIRKLILCTQPKIYP